MNLMEIDYINGQSRVTLNGISRYQNEIHRRLNVKLNTIEFTPANVKLGNFDLGTVIKLYLIYPLIVRKNIKKNNIKHVTSQNIAFLLNMIKLENSIVTCYDLIPWVYDNNRSFIWKSNIRGLKEADRIITISEFSKNEIIKYLKFPAEKIEIVHPAVNHERYNMIKDRRSILDKTNVSKDDNIVLYVGSEEPRQNVDKLIRAFAKLKEKLPNIKLIKIGNPNSNKFRENSLKLVNILNLQNDVIFVDYVCEEDLPKWYNAADLLVYPCAYAGFGLPPLEAMACGTPVITSNTTSLPEVVGDAGIMVNPDDVQELAIKMLEVLTDNGLSDELAKKGLKRAKLFNWDESARKTLQIYEEIND